MKICFHSNQLCLRGTEIALYDYAKYNEELLGNKSIIMYKHTNRYNHPKIIEKFKKRFPVFSYNDFFQEKEAILDKEKIDIFYAIKSGNNDGIISLNRKTVIHSVFQEYQPHGNVYAYISKWLGDLYKSEYVPHMIDLPDVKEDLRDELNIPKNAIVFGEYGGEETFDLPFVKKAIIEIASYRKDIYFVFLNIYRFSDISLKNIIFLEGTDNTNYKVKFINSCDAMIHARYQGESFGLSIAEFSTKNKPVFTWDGGIDKAHIDMLGNKGIYYNSNNIYQMLCDFKPMPDFDWNAYKEYNPKNVMNIFQRIFL